MSRSFARAIHRLVCLSVSVVCLSVSVVCLSVSALLSGCAASSAGGSSAASVSPAATDATASVRCPLPPRAPGSYDMSQLSVFSKVLLHVRESTPVDFRARSRELAVSALHRIASEDPGVVVEGDAAKPPFVMTMKVGDARCALDLSGVDSPWTLRSTLQEASRFVQGNLRSAAPLRELSQRLLRDEIAATNGMLSAIDKQSILLDAATSETAPPDDAAGGPRAPGPSSVDPSNTPGTRLFEVRRIVREADFAYARLGRLHPGVASEVERWLVKAKEEHVKGLVLDLRDNSGGLLEEATKVADAFLAHGSLGTVISTERGAPQRKELQAVDDGREPEVALVVLVNHATASGAELIAAAVKDLGRGVVLGERTAGAATLREMFDIPVAQERLILFLTTGRLLTSAGAEIDGVGVEPDLPPTCPMTDAVKLEDSCLLGLAGELIGRAKDPSRATLLAIARTLPAPSGAKKPLRPR